MSKYTTGEIAKLCGVSVRTVQYYDSRNILVPSALSEGGRRLYSEDDLKRMRIICFLRDAGISINSIGELLSEEHPEKVISILLQEQEKQLQEEVAERQKQLDLIAGIRKEMKDIQNFSVESIGDIAQAMKFKTKLNQIRALLLITGTPVTILQWVSIILWITNGIWWLFAVWVCAATVYGVWASVYYFRNVSYICPECHAVFKPSFKEAFWAYHTPRMRRLTCTNCGHKGMCVEVYAEKEETDNGKN